MRTEILISVRFYLNVLFKSIYYFFVFIKMKVFCIVLLCLMTLTQQGCTNYPITKVFKQNKSNYSLSNSNTWKDYPDLKISL